MKLIAAIERERAASPITTRQNEKGVLDNNSLSRHSLANLNSPVPSTLKTGTDPSPRSGQFWCVPRSKQFFLHFFFLLFFQPFCPRG